jgi:hypothetical protein
MRSSKYKEVSVMVDIIGEPKEKDRVCQRAGKELVDVVQEIISKDMTGTIGEAIQAAPALSDMISRAKNEAWGRAMWYQFALGILRDIGTEDFSLDTPYQPGSQG